MDPNRWIVVIGRKALGDGRPWLLATDAYGCMSGEGTIEFIANRTDLYFMEMNTAAVEHPGPSDHRQELVEAGNSRSRPAWRLLREEDELRIR